jgi:purine-binding chemotaxis protein CheW
VSERTPAHRLSAAALRESFDASFARPASLASAPGEHLLAVRVAGEPWLVRLAEIAGLYADLHVAWLPSTVPALRGIASLRGAIVPVYDLASLLGRPGGETLRWLVLSAGPRRVGLAFERFEGHLAVGPGRMVTPGGREGHPHVAAIVSDSECRRPVMDVGSLLEAIATAALAGRPAQEG